MHAACDPVGGNLSEMGMMKASSGLALALAFGALALQGCMATGGTRTDAAQADGASVQASTPVATAPAPHAQAASAPTQAMAPVATAPVSTAAIPEDHGKPVVKADTADNFAAIVAAVHQQMQPLGRWQYIDKQERATIDGSFADMQSLYDKFGSVDKMDQTARARLLADQNTVNAILTRKDGDRLICRSMLPVGSHLPVKTCKTYAQIQAEQNNAQDYLRRRGATMQRETGH